jgi:hypothetical protein
MKSLILMVNCFHARELRRALQAQLGNFPDKARRMSGHPATITSHSILAMA